MAIDAYSQCPGATGKKIKFCCPDSLPELEKIDRMMEGEQYAACLHHVEHLREQPANRDRQCLLAYQTMLLRATGRLEEAQAIASTFLEKYPTNQAALGESTILAALKKDCTSAMAFLQRSIAEAKGSWSWRTYQAAQTLIEVFIEEAKWVPARALLQFLIIVDRKNRDVAQMVTDLMRSPSVPLLLKEDPKFPQASESTPWANQFAQAIMPMSFGDWRTTESNLAALASQTADVPDIWRCLATVRSWLGDYTGCAEALHKYASFDVSQEDAAEAEATAMLLSDSPLGDTVPVLSITWTVKDAERLQEAILSDSRIIPVPFNPAMMAQDDSPPPKTVGMIFDRPAVDSSEKLSSQSMPNMLGQMFLFGRQTDREARLEIIGVSETYIDQLKSMIKEIAGQWLDSDEKTIELTTSSATDDLLRPQWHPPMDMKHQQYIDLIAEYRKFSILNQWPDIKLGHLDGLSPREAAADPKYRLKLLAAVLVLQHYLDAVHCSLDLNELRSQLGLPILEAIDPQPGKINQLPLVRLSRVNVEKLSDEDLVQAFQRSVGYAHRSAVIKCGREIINRPSFAQRGELSLAYMTLARMEDDLDQAIAYIEAGRRATDTSCKSHAMWDLEELSLRFARQDIPEALQLIKHIESTHINEPNVSMVLTQILIDAGLLRPDGTPAIPNRGPDAEMAPAAAGTEPGGLWTPDSESGGGGGKLWVPD